MSTTSTTSIYGIGSGLSNAASTTSSSSSSSTSTLSSSDYMTLFLAQLQNQDPTDPMQSYELAAQLAQFTTVQELSQATTNLGNLQQYSSDINNAQMSTLVGQDVTVQMNTMNVSSGTPSELDYSLSSSATVTATIKDSNGNTIDTVNLGSESAGSHTVSWNGEDSSGNTVSDGAYTCTLTATASDGTTTTIPTTISGQVTSCNLGSTPPTYTLADGTVVPVSSVSGVSTTVSQ